MPRKKKSRTAEYTNEAYQPADDDVYKISGSDDNDDVSTGESGNESNNDSAYQTVSEKSAPKSNGELKQRRKSTKKIRTTNKWDVFRETSEDNVTSSDVEFWKVVFVVTKIIFAAILFVFVLGAAVLSKSTLFLLIANIFPPNEMRNSSLKTARGHFRYHSTDTAITWIWSLVLVVVAPYGFTILLSIWKLIFKKIRPLEIKPLFLVLIVETVHSVGLSLFVFVLLPNLDPISGVLFCLSIVLLPALLNIIFSGSSGSQSESSVQKIIRMVCSIVAIVTAIMAVVFWSIYVYRMDSTWQKEYPGLLVLFVLSPIFVSIGWWENFVPKGEKDSTGLRLIKRKLRNCRTKVYLIANIWKTLVTVAMVTIIFSVDCENSNTCLETLYDYLPSANMTSATFGETTLVVNLELGSCSKYLPLYIALVNIVTSLICYRCCVAANMILVQLPSFSLPLILATPITLVLVAAKYAQDDLPMTDTCFLPFPQYISSLSYDWSMILASVSGYIAVVMVTTYVWKGTTERMQPTDRMFVQPMYCGVFLDQGLLLDRRKDEEDVKGVDEKARETDLPIPENLDNWHPDNSDWSPLRTEDTPFIYLCATMWHETELEMLQILKSLFRMDDDQCARRNLQLFFGVKDPDYYEFEAHIFFDDAFDYIDGEPQANGYVKQLIRTIDEAVSSVHAFGMSIPPPAKIDTPYGGRLVWRLPGGNKMIAHLKDKARIRHRKRWSQVMYIYYFLAHKLLSMGGGKDRVKTIADNTFILALDGDVDFQPSALRLLIDRMKRNPNVGAACGRIHPIGSGPMVWYQKFEYAVSHWLQKATEHVLGCVLCSPGCFSLMRGSALMDDNVMKRYTTPPTEPRHYVQYDQGEDRWLCTLMLQQGYRVEYCAASDALTYAPEGFYEFYNQRRRWTPSTMANILDLLLDFKNVTKRNNDISLLYVAYQMLLMVSSILTPGTIFLMILGAINMAYPQLSLYWALVLNLVPVGIFILLCYVSKSDTQLAYAAVLSTIYSLVMMLVIVGLIKQAADNGFCSVTTVFLCFVAGVFVISAFIHPQEFWCIIHGFLYFLAIPSMSMLLMLYSIGNLHVVSWGTREAPKPAAAQKPTEQKAPPPKKSTVQEWLEKIGLADKEGKSDYNFSFGNLFRCVCCPSESANTEDMKLRAILDRLDDLESKLTDSALSHVTTEDQHVHFSEASDMFEGARERVNPLFQDDAVPEAKKTQPWTSDVDLHDGIIETISAEETVFWTELIKSYLFPMEGDKKEQEKTQQGLIELRNTVCLFFLLVNALFVTIVFALQQVNADSGSISIELPCAEGGYGEAIEPISMAFTAVFGVLLLIQFLCMGLHRLSTFLQICSITEIKISRPKQLQDPEAQISVEKGLQLVKDMQAVKADDTKSVSSMDSGHIERQSTISEDSEVISSTGEQKRKDLWAKLARRRREQQFHTLSHNFFHNFKKLQRHIEDEEKGAGTKPTFAMTVNGVPTDDDVDNDVRDVKKKFNRLDHKSIHTIVQMSRDPRIKKSILNRGDVVSNRWRKAALKIKLQNAANANNASDKGTGKSKKGSGKRNKRVTVVDIAKLAIVDRDSKDIEDEQLVEAGDVVNTDEKTTL